MEQYTQEPDAAKGDKDKKVATRKHTLWGDVGLVEYIQETSTWECRIDSCEAKTETSKRISHHTKKIPPRAIFRTQQTGRDTPVLQQDSKCNGEIIHPYGSNAAPQEGNWNIDTCQKLQQ